MVYPNSCSFQIRFHNVLDGSKYSLFNLEDNSNNDNSEGNQVQFNEMYGNVGHKQEQSFVFDISMEQEPIEDGESKDH